MSGKSALGCALLLSASSVTKPRKIADDKP